jgi:hypothetical protein
MPFVDISQFNSDETEDALMQLREVWNPWGVTAEDLQRTFGQETAKKIVLSIGDFAIAGDAAMKAMAELGIDSRCPFDLQLVPATSVQEFKQHYPPILTVKSTSLELPEYSTERDIARHLNRQFCTLLAVLLRHYEEDSTTPIPDRITIDVESDNADVCFRLDCWVEPVG